MQKYNCEHKYKLDMCKCEFPTLSLVICIVIIIAIVEIIVVVTAKILASMTHTGLYIPIFMIIL